MAERKCSISVSKNFFSTYWIERSTPRGIDPSGVPRTKRLFWPTWKPTQRSLNKARKEILPLRLLNATAICQKKNVIRNAPKPLRTSAQHQATLMRILPKKPKPMRDIPQFKRNFSGSTLPKPRWKSAAANCARKTHGYMKKPKNSGRKRFGSEKKQKNRDNDQSYSRGYAVSLRPQFSPFTAGNGIIKEGMCDESEGFSDRAS